MKMMMRSNTSTTTTKVFSSCSLLQKAVRLFAVVVVLSRTTCCVNGSPVPSYGLCTEEVSFQLGCDIVLDPTDKSMNWGHQDLFRITSPNYSKGGKIINPEDTTMVCIPAGEYSALSINYVEGTSDTNPVTIINCGGLVVLDGKDSGAQGTGWWNTISAKGCKHIHLTGTGDPTIEYGFEVKNSRSHGIHFDEGSTDIEIDHVETHSNDYAGIVVRTYPRCGGRCGNNPSKPTYYQFCDRNNFLQNNTRLLHNYIHDLKGEGYYVGTSHYHLDGMGYAYQCSGENVWEPSLANVDIYENILEDIEMDAIQVGSAISNVKIHHNTIKRWATKQKYGHSYGIGMNPGSTGDVYANRLEGKIRTPGVDSEEYYGIMFAGQGKSDELSKIYNNVIVNVNNGFMFLNREDSTNQTYEFVHNTIYNFTGTSPVKLYCLGTIDRDNQPMSNITVRNNIFSNGPNAEIMNKYGFKKFYGNTNGIIGMECMDFNDAYSNNVWDGLIDDPSLVGFADVSILDFHLDGSSSLAIGTGVQLANGSPIPDDYDDVLRGDPNPDQGAYEWVP